MPKSTDNLNQRFATQVVQTLVDAGFEAVWAGGCVRDMLLGKTPKDYDVATNATPEKVRAVFGHRRTLAVGESFGVIIVLPPKQSGAEQIEVATFRTEGPYLDGRRPEAVTFATAEEDAQRRDFTINGMFYDPLQEKVLDYVGGESDLKQRIVRAIGNPRERMEEDKLRLLRAVRFTANLDFALDDATAKAVRDMADQLSVVSIERIAAEFRRMLANENRRHATELCEQLGLLAVILPELTPQVGSPEWKSLLDVLQQLDINSFEPALAVMLSLLPREVRDPATVRFPESKPEGQEEVAQICRRLKLSNEELDRITWLAGRLNLLIDPANLTRAQTRRLLAHPDASSLLKIGEAQKVVDGKSLDALQALTIELKETPFNELVPDPLLTGGDLIQLGLQPGPEFKALLDDVRDLQLEEKLTSRDAAIEWVREQGKP